MKFDGTRMRHGLAGAFVLAALAMLRATAAAGESAVFVAGRTLRWPCVFKELFGVPCPGCGLTRSFVHALGGDLPRAFALNAGGPLLLFGLVALAAALLISAFSKSSTAAPTRVFSPRALKLGAACYVSLLACAMLLSWARAVA